MRMTCKHLLVMCTCALHLMPTSLHYIGNGQIFEFPQCCAIFRFVLVSMRQFLIQSDTSVSSMFM